VAEFVAQFDNNAAPRRHPQSDVRAGWRRSFRWADEHVATWSAAGPANLC